MSEVRGCDLPDDLFYWPAKHVWARPEDDGTIRVGMTDVAQHLAGKIIVVNLRAQGKTLARGKSAGTLESGKWVGSIPTPVTGEVIAVNESLRTDPSAVNADPYGRGWLVVVRPEAWETERASLVTGADGIEAYRSQLAADGIECGKA